MMPTLPNPAIGTLVEALHFDGKRNPGRRAMVEGSVGSLSLTPVGSSSGEVSLTFSRFTKVVPTYAAKMDIPFRVDTLTGLQEGKMGDYLAIGPQGEMYPLAADAVEGSYVLDESNRPEPPEPSGA